MLNTAPTCPNCRENDKTYKVSLLYLEISARLNHQEMTNQPELEGLLADLLPGENSVFEQNQIIGQMLRSFTPPEGQKRVTRRVHPDSMIVFFGLFALLIVYQVAVTRPDQLPVIDILFAGSLLAYLLGRKTILRRYEQRIHQEQEENTRVERSIANWMKLYYCSRDQGVFNPEDANFVPVEQIHLLLE